MSSQVVKCPIPNNDAESKSAPAHASSTRRIDSSPFRSILFDGRETGTQVGAAKAPEFFTDLNLDQIVDAITAGRDEYALKPIFYTPLRNEEAIRYRHDILRDLEDADLFQCILLFADEMRKMRRRLVQADKLYYDRQKQRLFLDAVATYCGAVAQLFGNLGRADLRSRGFTALREYLADYTQSGEFNRLVAETQSLTADLNGIKYSLRIDGKRVIVDRYGSEADLSAEVLQIFDKFRRAAPREYQFGVSNELGMNHVEAAVLDRVAGLFPEVFSRLQSYCGRNGDYLNHRIATFDREVQFYVACFEYMRQFEQAGLSFCCPNVSGISKEIHSCNTFDLALAKKLIDQKAPVVTNDFYLRGPERVFVVSGPNQGGKTTFARTFGQLHYLASLGCRVPGSEARLFLFDQLFTHFEREEHIQSMSGKLEDELLRIHRILELATSKSILIMNESFLSTTMDDAVFLSKQILQRITELDMLCVSITFLDELASLNPSTVSMVSTVGPRDPALRTFKIVRKPADGLAYAAAIAEKYRLTQDAIRERIRAHTIEAIR